MATRTIHECDRCKREAGPGDLTKVNVGNGDKEVCSSCKGKLERIMQGAEVEVPP